MERGARKYVQEDQLAMKEGRQKAKDKKNQMPILEPSCPAQKTTTGDQRGWEGVLWATGNGAPHKVQTMPGEKYPPLNEMIDSPRGDNDPRQNKKGGGVWE